MRAGLLSSPTWNPGPAIQRWFPGVPWPTAGLARAQDRVRRWQRWPSVTEPDDRVALLDRLPGFQLAWLSGVRDVSVLLGLALSELTARRNITINGTCRVSPGPVALGPEPPPAFAGALATLSAVGSGSASPTVERLADQVIRDAGGRSRWRDGLVRDPLLALGLLVMPLELGPDSDLRAHAAAILAPLDRRDGVPTAAGTALVNEISLRAHSLATTATSADAHAHDPRGILHLADAVGSALLCFPELWPPVQAAAALTPHGPQSTGLFLTDLTDVMVSQDVGGGLWT